MVRYFFSCCRPCLQLCFAVFAKTSSIPRTPTPAALDVVDVRRLRYLQNDRLWTDSPQQTQGVSTLLNVSFELVKPHESALFGTNVRETQVAISCIMSGGHDWEGSSPQPQHRFFWGSVAGDDTGGEAGRLKIPNLLHANFRSPYRYVNSTTFTTTSRFPNFSLGLDSQFPIRWVKFGFLLLARLPPLDPWEANSGFQYYPFYTNCMSGF